DARYLAGVDCAGLRLGNDAADPLARGLDLRQVGRADLDHALVVDVDLGAGRCDDFPDHLASRTDDFADLVLGDRHGLDPWRVGAELTAAFAERFGHFTKDVRAAVLRLGEGGLHDLLGDSGDFDVHLQRSDAFGRAGDL